jgi:hypothetical protein
VAVLVVEVEHALVDVELGHRFGHGRVPPSRAILPRRGLAVKNPEVQGRSAVRRVRDEIIGRPEAVRANREVQQAYLGEEVA